MRTQQDNATVFQPAIDALRSELACLEQQSSRLRALLEGLEGLCAHAGEPVTSPGGTAAPSNAPPRASLVPETNEICTGTTKDGAKPKKTAPTKPMDDKASAAELSTTVAVIADAAAEVEGAMRAGDAAKVREAIATRSRAERRAGELLIALAGRLRLPGITKVQSKKYRRNAELLEDEFEAKLRRAQLKAVAAIGVAPKKKPAPAKAKPTTRPRRAMKISPWTTDATGALTRTLMAAVDGAEAT
jgi:hypothetical protein